MSKTTLPSSTKSNLFMVEKIYDQKELQRMEDEAAASRQGPIGSLKSKAFGLVNWAAPEMDWQAYALVLPAAIDFGSMMVTPISLMARPFTSSINRASEARADKKSNRVSAVQEARNVEDLIKARKNRAAIRAGGTYVAELRDNQARGVSKNVATIYAAAKRVGVANLDSAIVGDALNLAIAKFDGKTKPLSDIFGVDPVAYFHSGVLSVDERVQFMAFVDAVQGLEFTTDPATGKEALRGTVAGASALGALHRSLGLFDSKSATGLPQLKVPFLKVDPTKTTSLQEVAGSAASGPLPTVAEIDAAEDCIMTWLGDIQSAIDADREFANIKDAVAFNGKTYSAGTPGFDGIAGGTASGFGLP